MSSEEATQRYSYLATLREFTPGMQPDLAADEMRITFLGTGDPPPRIAQRMMSIFVEVGPWPLSWRLITRSRERSDTS